MLMHARPEARLSHIAMKFEAAVQTGSLCEQFTILNSDVTYLELFSRRLVHDRGPINLVDQVL